MNIIKFPGPQKVKGQNDPDPCHRLALSGPVSFTCTSCEAKSVVTFSGMVFRTIEFFCMSCGLPFRISNPGLSVGIKTKK